MSCPTRAADQSRQRVKASHPLTVAAQVREGAAPVGSDQLIGFLMGRPAERALQQAEGDDLSIGKISPAPADPPIQ